MNKRENIYSLHGFEKVFKFTVRQTFKNRGYLVSFIIFVLVMTLMGPIQYIGQRAGQGAAESGFAFDPADTEIKSVTIYNETPYNLDIERLKDLYISEDEEEGLKSEDITIIQGKDAPEEGAEAILEKLGEQDTAVIISSTNIDFSVSGIVAENTKISVDDLDKVSSLVNQCFDEARLEESDVSSEDAQMIFAGVHGDGVLTEDEYIAEKNKDISEDNYMFYMLGFSMIIFIVVSMSTSYIITSVTEEKQTKLVESILVSVRPMALLLGKVCGMMAYVVLLLVCGVIGSNVSTMVMKNVFNISEKEFSNRGFDFSIFRDFGVGGGAALLLSVVLAFLLFGMLSGLFGSACNKTEDIQSATGNVMTISMISYFTTIVVGAVDNDTINLLAALVPPFSFFAAPVTYVTGRISLPILLASYVIQIVLIVLLVRLSARSYRNLILSDSSTPKLKAIFKSAKN